MTRDEVLALRPGREMDHAIASLLGDVQDNEGWWISLDGVKQVDEDAGPRHYSTNPADALAALDAFCRADVSRYFEINGPFKQADYYVAINLGPETLAAETSDDIPGLPGLAFAVCRVLLLASGEGA